MFENRKGLVKVSKENSYSCLLFGSSTGVRLSLVIGIL